MITRINGHEYYLRDDMKLSTQLKISKAKQEDKVYVILFEALTTASGEKFKTIEDMADAIYINDFELLFDAAIEHVGMSRSTPDPLPSPKNSDSV